MRNLTSNLGIHSGLQKSNLKNLTPQKDNFHYIAILIVIQQKFRSFPNLGLP